LHELLRGAQEVGAHTEEIIAEETNLKYCKGCLRCNLLKHCAIKGDDWIALSNKIIDSNVLIFASPIYFHHLTASLKKVLDRFRSFLNVQITEDGLQHTPWQNWQKQFVILLGLGSSCDADARPLVDLFSFITNTLGPENRLHTIIATRLAVTNQIRMTKEQLETLYRKLQLPAHLAGLDYKRNQLLLKRCYTLGKELCKREPKS
jgi:hypothetical protein